MPEDIPTRTESKISTPYKFDLLLAFVSFVFPFGYSMSGFPPSIELACACWILTFGVVWHWVFLFSKRWKSQKVRWAILIIWPFLILSAIAKPIEHQWQRQHHPPTDEVLSELAAVRGALDGLENYQREVSSNWFEQHLTTLSNQKTGVEHQIEKIDKAHAAIDIKAMNLISIRDKTRIELEQRTNRNRLVALNNEIQAAKDRISQIQSQNQANNDLTNIQYQIAEKVIPIFDYTIVRLSQTLAKIAADANEPMNLDFFGGIATIHGSDLMRDGIITSGSNFISIGTNAAWKFLISTTPFIYTIKGAPFPPRPPDDKSLAVYLLDSFASLTISCRTTNGDSYLSITALPKSVSSPIYDDSRHPIPVYTSNVTSMVSSMFITLSVPSGLNLNTNQDIENSTNGIDIALSGLIGAQDLQHKMSTK